MKVGMALNMLCQEGRSDASVVGEHLTMGDLAEPLGFDSLFALEHHFTGYAMSPAPTQLLSYYAGRTKRISLGTAVIVLPWHDPVRVAEQIALLDIMCGGRCLFGFGRGAASVEYDGFRIPMGEARPRFVEAAQIIVKALSGDSFEHQGEFFQIPRTAIRPRPISHPERRFYASAVSPDSAEIMAKLGFGLLMVMQNEWPKAAEDIARYREIATAAGHAPRPPIILTNVCCAESRAEAQERATSISASNGSRSTTTTIFRTVTSRPSKAMRATARWRALTPRSTKAPSQKPRRPISTSASRSSARRKTASKKSPSCGAAPGWTTSSPNSRLAACRTRRPR
jgi:alkanesulfonate monooxygenase SsuD/methylene tetrahydromethanopterin reductase-like flavin-dependent oxidoreductase (luciferase family)